ncbi:hypothetical protein [Corynebacterium gerontici]|uniref:hypothetical protein n=1 Tax=Corynebacterium gerontici TaxID=2079234 RepID=UPI000F4E4BDB|nr:hypothetical protein [Corynebacterium gerontici]
MVADALLARREFQKEIDEGSFEQNAVDSNTRVAFLVATLREELQRGNNPEKRLLIPHKNLHFYSLSVFAVPDHLPDWLGWCLLQPRALGCSVSTDQPPTREALGEAIKGCRDAELTLTEIQEDIAAADGVFSSWSAVLVDATAMNDNLDLVTLCEFRVQSTWYAANCASEIAALSPETSNLNRRRMMIRLSQSAFERTRWLTERRLGANDPEKPKQILDQISATSDVQREVENAEAALSQALAHAELEIERRSAYGRKLLQVFSLIFASAGLAQVMLPLPITSEVFQEHLLAILIWLGMTLLGAVLVIRQER